MFAERLDAREPGMLPEILVVTDSVLMSRAMPYP